MGLESASFISDLDPLNPTGLDPVSQGDDHIRLLKSVLQSQFPNLGAAAANMTAAELNQLVGLLATTAELNFLSGVTSAIQTQLNAKAPIASPSFTGISSFAGLVRFSTGSNVASAATLNLPTDGNYFEVTGSNDISGIATEGVGTVVTLRFNNFITLFHNATSFDLPGEQDIDVEPGDLAMFIEYSTGNWRCLNYLRAANKPIVYREGVWTPSLGGNTTYNSRSGRYTRIGRLVHISGKVDVNTLGTGSQATISGLPFQVSTDSPGGLAMGQYVANSALNVNDLVLQFTAGLTTMVTLGSTTEQPALATVFFFGDGARVTFQGTYTTDS